MITRQPLNKLAPFQVSDSSQDSNTIVVPTVVVKEIVFADGSTMQTAGVPTDIDSGSF